MKEYVTYVHIVDDKPCYVGEGTKSRPHDFKVRSEEYQLFLLLNDVHVKIVGHHGDKVSAVLNEQGLISWIGIESLFNKQRFHYQGFPSYGFKGKKHKASTKLKMVKARAKQVLSEESRKKIGDKLRGRSIPDERKYRISETKKSRKLKCPYCGISGGVSNMRRYHFDNCKCKYDTQQPCHRRYK